jgi:hypothetical protein
MSQPDIKATVILRWKSGAKMLEIAAELGLTKGQVAGIVNRAALHRVPRPPAPKLTPRPADAKFGCRWIDRADHLQAMQRGEDVYCGAEVVGPEHSWCAAHRARVYVPATAAALRQALGAA